MVNNSITITWEDEDFSSVLESHLGKTPTDQEIDSFVQFSCKELTEGSVTYGWEILYSLIDLWENSKPRALKEDTKQLLNK